MPRIVTGYRPSLGIEEQIVEIHKENIVAGGLEAYRRGLTPEEVKDWFRDSRPEMFSAVLGDKGRIYAYTWVWVREKGCCPAFIFPRARLSIGSSELAYWTRKLLTWSKLLLLGRHNYRGTVVYLRLGLLYSLYTNIFAEILSPCLYEIRKPSGYLMELAEKLRRIDKKPSIKIIIREVDPSRDPEAASRISEIYNDAFSTYADYWPWSTEAVKRYYSNLFTRHKAVVYMAETPDGRAVGFIESYVFHSLSGLKVGYHNLLAVKRKYQGKGVGSRLLLAAEKWLLNENVDKIVLDAEPEAYSLYSRLGYRITRIGYDIVIHIGCIPDEGVHGVV